MLLNLDSKHKLLPTSFCTIRKSQKKLVPRGVRADLKHPYFWFGTKLIPFLNKIKKKFSLLY
jgi:hypothetical protein